MNGKRCGKIMPGIIEGKATHTVSEENDITTGV